MQTRARTVALFLSAQSLAFCFRPPAISRTSAHQTRLIHCKMDSRVAYLHGFASHSESLKGVALRKHMVALGLGDWVDTPDLNCPSFSELTVTDTLKRMDELHLEKGQPKWMLVGSSMGGYLAALWASKHPDRVSKLVLLCPACDFESIWPRVLKQENFDKWEKEGKFPFKDGKGVEQLVNFKMITDVRSHEKWPIVPHTCPTLVIHGEQDEVVPITYSTVSLRDANRDHPDFTVEIVQDDHGLFKSTPHILNRIDDFLQLKRAAAATAPKP